MLRVASSFIPHTPQRIAITLEKVVGKKGKRAERQEGRKERQKAKGKGQKSGIR